MRTVTTFAQLTVLPHLHIVTQFESFLLNVHTLQVHKRVFTGVAGFPMGNPYPNYRTIGK